MKRAWALVLVALAACAPNRGAAYDASLAAARRAYNAGRFAEAATHYDEAAKSANIARDVWYMRYEAALAHVRAGDLARGVTELRAIASARGKAHPDNAYAGSAALKLAGLAMANDEAEGYRELEAIVSDYPTDGVAVVALTQVLRHDDDVGGPATTLARLDALAPRVQDSGTEVEQTVVYERAKRLAALDRTEAARDGFLDVAKRWPYPFGVYFDDALFHASEMDEKLGRVKEAIDDLERLLSFRETSALVGTYERPRYVPAILRVADLYADKLHDRAKARETLHRLYTEFAHSTFRDDALWREAQLWRADGDVSTACDRLATLASDFPDSRYVPCAVAQCTSIKRDAKSKAPKECHAYLTRGPKTEDSP